MNETCSTMLMRFVGLCVVLAVDDVDDDASMELDSAARVPLLRSSISTTRSCIAVT